MLYIHHFKVGHDVRGQSWTVRMSVVVRYNYLELKHKHIGTRTYRYMGIERVYDTATHPGLSIKSKMSGIRGDQIFILPNIAVGEVSDQLNVVVAL